jgi:hypothetical protein
VLPKKMAPRDETFRTEAAWLNSTIDLYQFTLAKSDQFHVRDKKLLFDSNKVCAKFKKKQSASIALRDAASESKKRAEAVRSDALSELGLQPSDIPSRAQE